MLIFVTGAVGFLWGGAAGIIKGWPAFLSGSMSALQTFGLGATFSLSRSIVIKAWAVEGKPAPAGPDLVKASAIAGGISGCAVGFLARGRRNAIPGAIMFAFFGGTGQFLLNAFRRSKEKRIVEEPKENFWRRMSKKSWAPFKVLTNEEYAAMLKEKIFKLDVEIAVLDDKIVALKRELENEKQEKTSDT